MENMRLLVDDPNCRDGNCPKGFALDGGDVGIQGYTMHKDGLPAGESFVRVPRELVILLAEALCKEEAAR